MANDTASKQFPKHISCLKGFVEFCVDGCGGVGGGVGGVGGGWGGGGGG